jgi:hypothetical protein
VKHVGDAWIIILVHVDDMGIFFNGGGRALRNEIFKFLAKRIEVRNQGLLRYYLKMNIEYDPVVGIMKISQPYHEILFQERFRMADWKQRDTPLPASGKHVLKPGDYEMQTAEEKFAAEQFPIREFIGNIIWLLQTHPTLAFLCSFLGSHVNKPTLKLWENCKWAGGFAMKHCFGNGLIYRRPLNFSKFELGFLGYSDSSWGDCLFTGRSSGGFLVFFFGMLVSWSSGKTKPTQSTSVGEAEMWFAYLLAKELIYLMDVAMELQIFPDEIFKLA